MTIIRSFPAKRNVKTRVIRIEDDFVEFPFAVESLYPADEKSTKWDRRGVFGTAIDAENFALFIQPD